MCARQSDGVVLCWGGNQQNALGDGTGVDSAKPVLVSGTGIGNALGSSTVSNDLRIARRQSCSVLGRLIHQQVRAIENAQREGRTGRWFKNPRARSAGASIGRSVSDATVAKVDRWASMNAILKRYLPDVAGRMQSSACAPRLWGIETCVTRALMEPPGIARSSMLMNLAFGLCCACSDAVCPAGTTQVGELCQRDQAQAAAGNSDPAISGTQSTPSNSTVTPAGVGGESTANSVSSAASGGVGGASVAAAGVPGWNGGNGGQNGGDPTAGNNGGSRSDSSAAASVCGNGIREAAELCDGDCPATCDAPTGCLKSSLEGSPATCDARCVVVETTDCKSGDDCCAPSCKYPEDSDCSKSCGDGVVDSPELCEPGSKDKPCPTSCDDADPCTQDIKTGTPQQCNVVCSHTPVTVAKNGDQCCPRGGNANSDSDCSPNCGNKVKEGSEVCDGDCPTSCDDGDPCTVDKLSGSAGQCTAACTNAPIVRPANGDGCCPEGANASNDNDCSPSCGNRIKEGNEICDGDCPMSCTDTDPCTSDKLSGSASQCNAVCTHSPMTRTQPGNCADDDPCTDDSMRPSTTSCTFECVHGPAKPRTGPTACNSSNPCIKPTSPVPSKTSCTQECKPGPEMARSGPTSCTPPDACTESTKVDSSTDCISYCDEKPKRDGASCNGSGTCSAGVCLFCGDKKITGSEECDPNAPGWSAVSCGSNCKRSVYRLCSTNGDCGSNETCYAGICGAHCSRRDDPVCKTLPNTSSVCVGAGDSSACAIVCNGSCPSGFSQSCIAVAADIEGENTYTLCGGNGF